MGATPSEVVSQLHGQHRGIERARHSNQSSASQSIETYPRRRGADNRSIGLPGSSGQSASKAPTVLPSAKVCNETKIAFISLNLFDFVCKIPRQRLQLQPMLLLQLMEVVAFCAFTHKVEVYKQPRLVQLNVMTIVTHNAPVIVKRMQ